MLPKACPVKIASGVGMCKWMMSYMGIRIGKWLKWHKFVYFLRRIKFDV
jgi:hypothetical protein